MQGAAIRKQDAPGRGIKVVALRAGEPIGEWEVRKDTVTFGRSVTADVALQDNKKLSRIHCSFELRADGVWVRDAGSANGVWLHDRRVTEALLSPGDSVVAAGIRLSATAVEENEPTLRLLPAFDPSSVVVSPTPAPVVVLSAAPGPFVDELADQIAHLPIRVSRDEALSAPFALTIGGRRYAHGTRAPRTMLWISVAAVTLVVGGATVAALLS